MLNLNLRQVRISEIGQGLESVLGVSKKCKTFVKPGNNPVILEPYSLIKKPASLHFLRIHNNLRPLKFAKVSE
jgi:hypothetical protein